MWRLTELEKDIEEERAKWQKRRNRAERELEAVCRRQERVEAVARVNQKAIDKRNAELTILLGSKASTPAAEVRRVCAPLELEVAEFSEDDDHDGRASKRVSRHDKRRAKAMSTQKGKYTAGTSHGPAKKPMRPSARMFDAADALRAGEEHTERISISSDRSEDKTDEDEVVAQEDQTSERDEDSSSSQTEMFPRPPRSLSTHSNISVAQLNEDERRQITPDADVAGIVYRHGRHSELDDVEMEPNNAQDCEHKSAGWLDVLDMDARAPNRRTVSVSRAKAKAKATGKQNTNAGHVPAMTERSSASRSSSGLFASERPQSRSFEKHADRGDSELFPTDRDVNVQSDEGDREGPRGNQPLQRQTPELTTAFRGESGGDDRDHDSQMLFFEPDDNTFPLPVTSPPPGWPRASSGGLFVTPDPDPPSSPPLAVLPQSRDRRTRETSESVRKRRKGHRRPRRGPTLDELEAAEDERDHLRGTIGLRIMAGIDEGSP